MSGFQGQHPRVEQVYDLGKVLGKGSFSTVYQGTHKQTKEVVALKVIPSKNYRHNDRAKQLLRTEVAVMSRIRKLAHPHLMQFKHTFEDAEKIVMVLEFLSGGELFDRIVQRGNYSEQDASRICRVIVEALASVHSTNILHRDLKPENCIYSTGSEDSLKITDFGLAAITQPGEGMFQDRHLVGTPGYIAPEVLNHYLYGPPSDIWAAGVILFIMLSGSPPFYGRTHKEIFEKIKAGRWAFNGRNWSQVSENAKDLVRKMLTQDYRQRITAEGVLDHPWIKEHAAVSQTHLPDTVADLKKFSARQKFKAAAMVCIAGSRLTRFAMASKGNGDRLEELVDSSLFTQEELEKLKAEFAAATAGGSQTLDFGGFSEVMTKLNFSHLPLQRIFKVFDSDGSGNVDYKEFLIGLSKFRLKGEQALKFCFEVFDEDKSGTITRDELTKVLVHTRRRSREQIQVGGASLPPAPPAAGRAASPPEVPPGPMIVASDDGVTTELVPSRPTPSSLADGVPYEKLDLRFMSMDPDAYEVAEGIAEIFDSLDENGDNQITLDEFLNGIKRHPEILELFFKEDGSQASSSSSSSAGSSAMQVSTSDGQA